MGILAFISSSGLGLMALTPCPTIRTAWLTNTDASVGRSEQVTAVDSPTATSPSDGDMANGGGTSHKNGAGTYTTETAVTGRIGIETGQGEEVLNESIFDLHPGCGVVGTASGACHEKHKYMTPLTSPVFLT